MIFRKEEFYILDSNKDYNEWLGVYNIWENKEPFAHPSYCLLFCNEKTTAHCAILSTKYGLILYPFLLRDISKENYGCETGFYDIISPYGYGGRFIVHCSNKELLFELFEFNFNNWVKKNNIISEVVKFHLFTDEILPYSGNEEIPFRNIVVDLTQSKDEVWSNFDHKVRKNVNKAKRNNLIVISDNTGKHIDDFIKIYHETMDRRSASENYYFNEFFFRQIISKMQGNFIFFYVMQDNNIISTELCLLSSQYIYSFLGGTTSKYFDLRPNDFLKYEIILWGIENNKSAFVLGGGYSGEDGIFKYKNSFAPQGIVDFKIGTKIFNKDIYNLIVESKIKYYKSKLNIDWTPKESFVPSYRS
jgi:hypothetical protein